MKRIKFNNLAIQGFRSFKRDIVFEFSKYHGFFLLTGRNDLQPELGANGAGKSTVWDALVWVLYGRTARGLKAKAVSNWESNEATSILLELTVDKQLYAICRTWDPNTLTLQRGAFTEPKAVTNQQIEDLVGLSYEGFLHTVLMGQFNRFFFDLKPTEKLEVFAEALGLEVWERAAVKARQQANDAAEALRNVEGQAREHLGRTKGLKVQIQDLKENRHNFEADRAGKLAALVRERDQLKQDAARYAAKLVEEQTLIEKLRSDESCFAEMLVKSEADIKVSNDLMDRAHAACTSAHTQIRLIKQRIAEFSKLGGGRCPTCESHVKEAHVHQCVERIQRELEWERGERDRFSEKWEALKLKHDVLVKERDDLQDDLSRVNARLKRHEATAQGWEDKLRPIDAALAQVRGRIAELKGQGNPYSQSLKQARQDYDDLLGILKGIRQEIDKLEVTANGCNYWAKEFKSVRLWVVEQALVELAIEVNNSLIQLGLEGWEVSFDVERETDGGGISKGFNVFVKAPDSPKNVPWESWCGGETQRLRIAGAIGIARLITNRRAVKVMQEAWDEPTAHLSEEGINDLLEFFEARAHEDGRQVWIIDHRSLSYGGFDGQVAVIKDDRGSRIVKKTYAPREDRTPFTDRIGDHGK